MNLDECIATLPRCERGIPRDIFSPRQQLPDPYSLELVSEYSRFSTSLDDPLLSTTTKNGRSPTVSTNPSSSPRNTANPPVTSSSNDGRLYCSACKKSFGTEATWNSHQNSAKHLAAVKEADKKNKSVSAKGTSGGRGNSKSNPGGNNSTKSQATAAAGLVQEEQHPEVKEALATFRKIEKVVNENPSMSATILWKIAKAQSAAPGTLTPTQIGMTLYLSRLALARLVVYISPLLASQYFLEAIHGRWQIDLNDFQTLREMVTTSSVTQLTTHCKTILSTNSKTKKLMLPTAPVATPATAASAVPKKPTDPNLKLVTILMECASLAAQLPSAVHGAKEPTTGLSSDRLLTLTPIDQELAETAVVLFSMGLCLLEAQSEGSGNASVGPGADSPVVILRKLAILFRQLRMGYAASACLIRAGEVSESSQGVSDQTSRDRNLWDLMQALVWAMESADFVRMQRVVDLMRRQDLTRSLDVQTMIAVANAVISQDNDYLSNQAQRAIEHLVLLIQEGNSVEVDMDACREKLPAALLLCRHNNSFSNCISILKRVQRLVR
ncbi:hypothetical protein BGW38_004923 [Lunasporangiospora selenospora]|uniref:C2H2-type domain-containing protein n=1 Tax=Lunasporangiospora selenospora TaxID=979761 RepID=A0A9P6G220_9FUNG|nr:hypothetical protein BGW38_004923 [Lunasporangiospora selenospora]